MTDMPEGWYTDPAPADPSLPTTMRYWDGRQWTPQVRSAKRAEIAEWRQRTAAARLEMAAAQAAAAQAAQATQVAPGDGSTGEYAPQQQLAPWTSRDFTWDGQRLAGWWSRVGAVVIDWILTTILSVLFGWRMIQQIATAYRDFVQLMIQASESGAQPPDPSILLDEIAGPFLAFAVISISVKFVYQVGFLKGYQATPGKLVLGIEVRRRVERGPMPWGTVLLRWFAQNIASLLSAIPVVGFVTGIYWLLDVLWPLWDPNRQAIHDKIARTNVVRRD